jgi:hypothetical protein
MKLQSTLKKLGVSAVCVLALSAIAFANGEEFFENEGGETVLYFFGHIKDSKGKVLDNTLLTVAAKNVGMNFPFKNDAPGHFRSPDVGKAIQGLGKKVDPAQIEIKVSKAGYKLVSATKVPNKLGAIQIEVVMDPDASAK